LFESWR